MGKIKVEFPDDLVKKLAALGNRTDEVLEKTLQAGADAVRPVLAGTLAGVIGKNTKGKSHATGQLAGSLGISPMKTGDDGSLDVKVGFNEPRRDGKRNAMVASILEHGRSNQPARPFLKPAQNAAKKPAVQAMIDTFNKEAGL